MYFAYDSLNYWRKCSEMDDEKVQLILSNIEDKIFDKVNLGFDHEVLEVLDNPDVSYRDIGLLKPKIGDDIMVRLFGIANSVHYGQLRSGPVDTFYKVASWLGIDFTKVLIIFLAFASLSKDKEVKIIFTKSFATSILGAEYWQRNSVSGIMMQ